MRLLREDEKKLIQCLLKEVDFKDIDLENIRVNNYDDGGMGSLWFESKTAIENRSMYSHQVSKRQTSLTAEALAEEVNIKHQTS